MVLGWRSDALRFPTERARCEAKRDNIRGDAARFTRVSGDGKRTLLIRTDGAFGLDALLEKLIDVHGQELGRFVVHLYKYFISFIRSSRRERNHFV